MGREDIKSEILRLTREYFNSSPQREFSAPVSGKVYDEKELQNLVEASLEGWWTEAEWTARFEGGLKNFLGIRYCLAVNSGSSANFLALKTLTSPKFKERRIRPGDEVITVAAGFPTTVNPIIDIGAIPVFLDVELGTYNIKVSDLKRALSERTKAVMIAHSLGNPFNIKAVKEVCEKNELWLIEDNCDALGSKYEGQYTGTFGHISTLSFYPAHHITTAEGGAVLTSDPLIFRIARSVRDWGRDCWCPTGKDNTCNKRFSWQLGELPAGYDHKYIYSEMGYNLKMTDLQAAIGVAQLEKLEGFVRKRKENFEYLYNKLQVFEEFFILPRATEGSEPSWFGFPLTIKDKRFNRQELLQFLTKKKIGTRLLFGGNLTKQPYFIDNKVPHRIIGELKNTNTIMEQTFWIGVYPGLQQKHLEYIYNSLKGFIEKNV